MHMIYLEKNLGHSQFVRARISGNVPKQSITVERICCGNLTPLLTVPLEGAANTTRYKTALKSVQSFIKNNVKAVIETVKEPVIEAPIALKAANTKPKTIKPSAKKPKKKGKKKSC